MAVSCMVFKQCEILVEKPEFPNFSRLTSIQLAPSARIPDGFASVYIDCEICDDIGERNVVMFG